MADSGDVQAPNEFGQFKSGEKSLLGRHATRRFDLSPKTFIHDNRLIEILNHENAHFNCTTAAQLVSTDRTARGRDGDPIQFRVVLRELANLSNDSRGSRACAVGSVGGYTQSIHIGQSPPSHTHEN